MSEGTFCLLLELDSLAADLVGEEEATCPKPILLHFGNTLTIGFRLLVGIHRKVQVTINSVLDFLLTSERSILGNLTDDHCNGHVFLAPTSDVPHRITLLLSRTSRTTSTLRSTFDGLQRIHEQEETLTSLKLVLLTNLISKSEDIRDIVEAGEVCVVALQKSVKLHLLKLHLDLSTTLFARVIQHHMTLLCESVRKLERDSGLTAAGKTTNHATGARTNPFTSEQSIDVLPTSLKRGTQRIRNLDIRETSRFNGLRKTTSSGNLSLLSGLLHSSLLHSGLLGGGLHSSLLRRLLHALRISPKGNILKLILLFLFLLDLQGFGDADYSP